MKKTFAILAATFLAGGAFAAAGPNTPAIIPKPRKIEVQPGRFQLTKNTFIEPGSGSGETAVFLARRLTKATGLVFALADSAKSASLFNGKTNNLIFLTAEDADTNLGPEGYQLTVATNCVVIRAPAQAGLFYGVQTLLQLLPPEIFSNHVVKGLAWQIPCVQITDWPRFKWRGLMLDVSRHFYSKGEVEKLLDLMALYKLNRFHWHLTDDQGWRIQIKKYPRLTQVGAWRTRSSLAGRAAAIQNHVHPAWLKPAADKFGPDRRYGGFYTQKDIREVVAYAAARHITIVPEIEMPGHSVAALAAYPQYSCFGGPYSTDVKAGVHKGIYDPANPATFNFLENILTEVFQLFPGKYVHIGGDEVRKGYWAKSPDCQALMKREGFTNEFQLQSYFIKRIQEFVSAHGKRLIGWSEILKGGLAPNAVVMDWIGGGKEAAESGHDAVMTPTRYCYLNSYQSTDYAAQPFAWGGNISLREVYSFEPIPQGLPPRDDSHILGAQASLWTEWIASLPHAEYMLFPRLCAMAEVVWSPRDARNWNDFQRRLALNERRLGELGVNYYHP